MKKKMLCLAAALMMLLSGCEKKAPASDTVPEPAVYTKAEQATGTIYSYLPSTDGTRLVAQSHEMVIPEGQQLLKAAIIDLLADPGSDTLLPLFGGGATLSGMIRSGTVLFLNIHTEQKLEQINERMLLSSAAALADTVTVNSNVEYIRLWINGQSVAPRGMLTNPLTVMDTDLESLWIRHRYYMEYGMNGPACDCRRVLFYADPTSQYLLAAPLPEPASADKQLEEMVNALRTVPEGMEGCVSAIPSTWSDEKAPVMSGESDGSTLVTFSFSAPKYEQVSAEQARLLAGALTLSVQSCYPDTDGVRIYLNRHLLQETTGLNQPAELPFTYTDLLDSVADYVTLYFPGDDGRLTAVSRAACQEDTASLRYPLDALLRGPQVGENTACSPTFPMGMKESDLLSVQLQGSCAIVNFTAAFRNMYPADPEKERLMIYSIVNTLTEDPAIHTVRILVEDRSADTLGRIDLTNPLLANPGLIREEKP